MKGHVDAPQTTAYAISFISPFFIGYAIFFLYPVLWALYLSFFQQVGIGSEPRFIGLENYTRLFSDNLFRKALVNTTFYAAGSIFLIDRRR